MPRCEYVYVYVFRCANMARKYVIAHCFFLRRVPRDKLNKCLNKASVGPQLRDILGVTRAVRKSVFRASPALHKPIESDGIGPTSRGSKAVNVPRTLRGPEIDIHKK